MSAIMPPPPLAIAIARWPALIPPVLIAIPIALKFGGVPINNAWIIFALLFGLMLTGMPISISLGLTVLTYLFTMTKCRSSRSRSSFSPASSASRSWRSRSSFSPATS